MNLRLTTITLAALLIMIGFPMAALGQGITVTPTSLTIDEGGTGTFTVVLTTEPTDNVTIGVSSSDTAAGTIPIASASLEFTPDSGATPWDNPQTVTVTAVPDYIIGSAAGYIIDLDVAASADSNYDGLDPDDVSVTNTDTDVADFDVQIPAGGLTTDEDGSQATFTIKLMSKPSDDVTIAISSDSIDEGTVLPASLTFTPDNWNGLQTVTVTGVADGSVDGDVDYEIILGPVTSLDANYDGFVIGSNVPVTNIDNNSAGFTVNPTSLSTKEGETATFNVVLNSQPGSDVIIEVKSSDETQVTASPSTLTFTTENWDASDHIVTVEGVKDGIVEDPKLTDYTVELLPATSSDDNYNGKDPDDVTVTNEDIDSPGYNIVPDELKKDPVTGHLKTTEDGGWATFTVNLKSQPQPGEVWLNVISNGPEGSVLPSGGITLIFTQSNWKVPQTITVQGMDDSITDGNQVYSIGLTPNTFITEDPDYKTAPPDVTMINIDNETADILVGTASNHTTEAGVKATFTVKLVSQPMADVIINVSSLDISEGKTDKPSLTFTPDKDVPGGWNMIQTVEVTGQDDYIQDGNQTFTVRLDPSPSIDTIYKDKLKDVSVINDDNDTAGFTIGPTNLETTEDGGTAFFDVRLNSEPMGDVVIGVTSENPTEGNVDKASLTFTPLNWGANQTVTITGLDDATVDGDQEYTVGLVVNSSDDSSYSLLDPGDIIVTNIDTDTPGVRITLPPEEADGILETSEDGDAAAFTVRLDTKPETDVIVDVKNDYDTTEGTVSPLSLTFTPLNWNAYKVVTVTGEDDDETDGNITYSITLLPAVSDDPDYQGKLATGSPVKIMNIDNNLPGFTISPATGLSTTEDGETATFTLKLNTQPIANVTVGVSSSDETEGTVSPATLTFTQDNWNASDHIVTITGVDDSANPVADGDQQYSIILAPASSTDSDYDSEDPDDVEVTNIDNETPGFIVEPLTGLTTSEDAETATFTAKLNGPPTADVVITVSSSDLGEGTVIPATLTLTPDNWNSSIHSVTVTGVDDGAVTDGDQSYQIILEATSDDPNYSGINPPDVSVINEDNDEPGFIVELGGDTSEDGGTDSFTVKLQSQPTANVTISVTSENINEGTVNKSSLVFTTENWNANQTVTVSGIDDNVIDGNQNYTIALGVAVSSDANYNDLNPTDVVMTNIDNDAAGFIVGTADDDTTEDGGTATFSIRLKTKPVADVSVDVSSSDIGEGTASPSTLVFTPADWSILHYVTATGIDDNIMDGTHSYNILLAAAVSSDSNYDGVAPSPNTVAVNNLDNDSPGFIIYPKTGLTTTEDLGTDTFTVKLISQPSAEVTIGISSLDDSEGKVDKTSLTFTSANWNTEQTVTVTGVDDSIADGNQNYTVVTSEAVSTDPDYSGQYPGNVAAVNIDDDSAVCDVTGDIDGNGFVDLGDAILGLRILAGIDYSVNIACDVSGEGRISIEEVLYALRKVLIID